MPRGPAAAVSGPAQWKHQNALEDDILATGRLSNKTAKKRKSSSRDDEEGNAYVDSKSSRKILKIGQELAEEDKEVTVADPPQAFAFESRFDQACEPEEDVAYEDEEAWGDDNEEIVEEVEIDPNDLHMFNKFLPPGEEPTLDLQSAGSQATGGGTNLADLILQQIAAKEAGEAGQPELQGGGIPEDAVEIPAKVVEVYSKIGLILSRYKSGKLPKPFKIIPTLPQWETLLSITRPENWTPNACYEATRIFVSATPGVVRGFIESVLLDRVRDDIHESKKLNVHLYKALQKATYKPAGFFKGLLFPLVESGTCTLREAHIIASVVTKCSIPALHSAAALLRLTDLAAEQATMATEGTGAVNIFIRAFLDKGYALPYKVVDGLVFHFLRFRAANPASVNTMADVSENSLTSHKLPVLWHQSLLSFAQRYRNDITEDQREALLDLLLVCGHSQIGPEVRRELLQGRGRGVVVEPNSNGIVGGDDTMLVDPV
jgi:essential nuclear protein 1